VTRYRPYDEIDAKLEGVSSERLQETLRERNRVGTLIAQVKLDPRYNGDKKYEDYQKENICKEIGFRMFKDGVIKFTSETERDLTYMETIKVVTGKVEVWKLK